MVPHRPAPGNQALLQSVTVENGAAAVVSAEVAESLRELLLHDVSTWVERGLEQVKLRTVRRVFRGKLGDVPVYIKVFRADTIAARARKSLRADKGEREANNLIKVRELGIDAVEPLAYGSAIEGEHRNSFLVTRGVPATPFAFSVDQAAATSVGELVRRVHDTGLEPGDLHPGNVLVLPDGQPILCDLTSVRFGGEMSLRKRAAALSFFCNPIDGGPLDERTRAFRNGYEAAGRELPDSFQHELARATRQLRATAIRSFGRRSTRSCKHTETEANRRGRPRWFWHLDEGQRQLAELCTAFDGSQHEPRRSGRRGSVWLLDSLAIKERDAGKARKLWLAHYWLLFAKVPAAKPVALRLQLGRGHVFVRRVANDDLQCQLDAAALGETEWIATARVLGDSVGRLHGHGLRNRDLKFENLVRDPATGAIRMVDLDGVTLHSAEDTRGCGRDLGRLLASFRNNESPGGQQALRAFVRAYVRARHKLLQQPPIRRILTGAERRAGQWRASHRSSSDEIAPKQG